MLQQKCDRTLTLENKKISQNNGNLVIQTPKNQGKTRKTVLSLLSVNKLQNPLMPHK